MRKLLQIKVAVLICRLYSPLLFTRKAAFVECVPPHTPVHRLLYTHSTFLFSFKFKFTQVLLKNELACAAVFSLAPIVKGHLFKKKKNSPLLFLELGSVQDVIYVGVTSAFGADLDQNCQWRDGEAGCSHCNVVCNPTHTHTYRHTFDMMCITVTLF